MSSPTSPTHGKLAAVYVLRPNGFKGSGLNDATWGTGYNGAASAYFEVVIDHAAATDSFKWRKNGGAWTEDVAMTGAAQTLSDGQQITFAATTGHTAADQWVIGNLKDEACTEATTTGQITDAAKRILNPNAPPTFTDSGGKAVTEIDFTQGKGYFAENVAAVTVTGNNGYIPLSALQKVGYLIGTSLNLQRDMADASHAGLEWKEGLPGLRSGNGSAEAFLIGGQAFFETFNSSVSHHFLQIFTYDPDQDQTGDHFRCWANLKGIGLNAPMGEIVKEKVDFDTHGMPSFVSNV